MVLNSIGELRWPSSEDANRMLFLRKETPILPFPSYLTDFLHIYLMTSGPLKKY